LALRVRNSNSEGRVKPNLSGPVTLKERVFYSFWFCIASRAPGITRDAFRYQICFNRDTIIEYPPDKMEVFRGVIELPEFFPIGVPSRV
jgi:hypothetical protein